MNSKNINFEFCEYEIIYILNCICLTKDILKFGRKEFYDKYFKKEMYNTYMFDLTLIQKLMGYKANKELYNFDDYDFFIGQHDYFNIGDREFKYLFGKKRMKRLKEIKQEIKYHNKVLKNKIGIITIKSNINKFFKHKWYLDN